MPARKKLLISDAEILQALADGKTRAAIARENGVDPECVRWRLRQLSKNLPAPAARRADDTVSLTLSAMDAVRENVRLLYELRDSCREVLAGPDGRIDVGPHDFDLTVLVAHGAAPPRRVPLKSLIDEQTDALSIESRAADPRQLLLATLKEIKSHVQTTISLVERIHDAQEYAEFQRIILEEIDAADAPTQARIRGRLHQRRTTRLALEPPRSA